MDEDEDFIAKLSRMIDEAGLTLKFGLEAQGHLPTIRTMLAQGEDWDAIGKAIGWWPWTARDHWQRFYADESQAAEREV